MFEQILPWNAGLKLIFVKPNRDLITEKVLLQVTNSWLVPAVVAEKDVESLALGVLSELVFVARAGRRRRTRWGLLRTLLGRIRFQVRYTPLGILDLLADGKLLGRVAGRGFCYLQMLQLTVPDINRSLGHVKTFVGSCCR